jgi:amino acid transporter
MRRFVISLSALGALAVAFLTASPAAFATRVPVGGGAPSRVTAVHHSGLGFWPGSLLVIAGVVVLIAAVVAAVLRMSRRSAPAAATN